MSLETERREYTYATLSMSSLADSPTAQFSNWMDEALSAGIQDPTAMSVATVSATGGPWQRIVLLKGFDEHGLKFYSNFDSRKGEEIDHNNQVSCHFAWLAMDRQVIVSGTAEKTSMADAEAYFAERPRESQLAALISHQSQQVPSRESLEKAYQEAEKTYAGRPVPKPAGWGGYLIKPREWEFWQGGRFRLHDRFSYQIKEDGQWQIQQLAP